MLNTELVVRWGCMRISRIQTFLGDAGWRPWTFVKIETDDGLVGWGGCSDTSNPYGVTGWVRDFEPLLVPRIREYRVGTVGQQGQGTRRAGVRAVGGPLRDRMQV